MIKDETPFLFCCDVSATDMSSFSGVIILDSLGPYIVATELQFLTSI